MSEKVCSVEGCHLSVQARSLCHRHYRRLRSHGSADGFIGAQGKGWDGVINPDENADPCSYETAHFRVKKFWGSASQYLCVSCDAPARHWAYDGTDPQQRYGPPRPGTGPCPYSRFPEFYMPMCHVCHRRKDGALAASELREYREWKLHFPGVSLQTVGLLLQLTA